MVKYEPTKLFVLVAMVSTPLGCGSSDTRPEACVRDNDCKADRICVEGACTDPGQTTGTKGGGGGPGGCVETGSECSADAECCSAKNDGKCVQTAVGKFCAEGCTQSSDCESTDCCGTLPDGSQACVLDNFLEPLSMTCAHGICQPAPDDSTCSRCIKESCCTEYEACADDTNCVCYLACLVDGGSVTSCGGECGAASSVSIDAYTCVTGQCSSCPF